jgi:hypothetical protein
MPTLWGFTLQHQWINHKTADVFARQYMVYYTNFHQSGIISLIVLMTDRKSTEGNNS